MSIADGSHTQTGKEKSSLSPGVLAAAAGYRAMESWRESGWERMYAVSSSVLGAQGSNI